VAIGKKRKVRTTTPPPAVGRGKKIRTQKPLATKGSTQLNKGKRTECEPTSEGEETDTEETNAEETDAEDTKVDEHRLHRTGNY
jgi:hypothetical protein